MEIVTDDISSVIEETILRGNTATFTVVGNSMYPLFYNKRDTASVRKADKFGVGDVILYRRSDGSLVLHRIVKKRKGVIICSGDNQDVLEEVDGERILGKMVAFVRKGKRHTTANVIYRTYSAIWRVLLPIRVGLLNKILKSRR